MINVIGIGQNRENMTLGAVRAIEESDVIVGYKTFAIPKTPGSPELINETVWPDKLLSIAS